MLGPKVIIPCEPSFILAFDGLSQLCFYIQVKETQEIYYA